MKLIPIDEYFDNDHYCDVCASKDGDYVLASPNHFEQYYQGKDNESD